MQKDPFFNFKVGVLTRVTDLLVLVLTNLVMTRVDLCLS